MKKLAVIVIGFVVGNLFAAEIVVDPGGLAEAVKQAAEGDTLLLRPGVYREHVEIGKELTLHGTGDVLLEGSEPLDLEWSEAGGELEGVYIAPMKNRPRGLLVGGKFVAMIRFDRAKSEGDWNWRTLLAKGPPLSGFEEIRALWMYHPDEQRIYARFENAAQPQDLELAIVKSSDPLLRIRGAKVVIEGLALAGAETALVFDEGAADGVVRHCTIHSFEKTGIVLTRGATRCMVQDCEITRGALEEWTPSLEHNRANYEIWRIHKDVGNYDRNGIDLVAAGAANRIVHNHIFEVFDGITVGDSSVESLDKELIDPDHGRGTEIADNWIERTRDSGIELGVGCIEVNVHGNELRRTHGGLRFKLPRIGPLFIHHNRLVEGSPFNIWFSMDASPAEAYVYHNTIEAGWHEALSVAKDSMKRESIAPNWHFLNNLVTGSGGFCEPSKTKELDFIASHNVVEGTVKPWPDDPEKDQGSVYGVKVKLDDEGRPVPGSAAIDAGLDLGGGWKGRPLPGCGPGYFKGKAPDAGADEVE